MDIICKEKRHTGNPAHETIPGTESILLEDKKIICINCRSIIADTSDLIRDGDSDFSIFRNPAGIFFRVACFSRTPGCVTAGEYTGEHSWFAGYKWCYALCGSCHIHLGWHFISGENSFWGLIADRLTGF